MRERSLVRQILLTVLGAQLGCAIALSGAALLHERNTRLRAFDVVLQGRSDSLLGAIQDADDPADNIAIDPTELRLPGDDVYAVFNQGGGPALGGLPDVPERLIRRRGDGFRTVRVHGVSYRVLEREGMRVIDRGENGGPGLRRPVTLVYASPDGRIRHEILEAARFYLFAIFASAVLTAVGVALLLRLALRPLSDLTAAAGRLAAPALRFQAPPSVERVRELRPLAAVLTEVVRSLRLAFEKEQRFVGDAAHELKTAVAVVRSSLQVMMLRRRSAEEYAAGLERVLEDNGRVEALVAQMLRLASVEEAAPGAVPWIDLAESARLASAHLAPVAEVRGVSLRTEIEAGTMVRLPAERAMVLVSNLVLNAIQHSEPGSAVDVLLAHSEAGAVLEVADRGAGIGEAALPHIFERFYREDRSRSRETGGAGLGLSISKSIVDAASGTIAVSSRSGLGTTVRVTFRQH